MTMLTFVVMFDSCGGRSQIRWCHFLRCHEYDASFCHIQRGWSFCPEDLRVWENVCTVVELLAVFEVSLDMAEYIHVWQNTHCKQRLVISARKLVKATNLD